jgi:hypothetical protein
MKNENNDLIKNIQLKVSAWCFLLFILFMMSFDAIAQNNYTVNKGHIDSMDKQFYKVISFGDKIGFGDIENSVTWTISNNTEGVYVRLTGNQINDYIFDKPGIYEIIFSENKKYSLDACSHEQFPDKLLIKVSDVAMIYDFSTLQFKEELVGGVRLQNTEISVNVFFKSYKNEKATFSKGKIISAGIGTTIIGSMLNDATTLSPGINEIRYQLNGMATSGTYIMFDFYDINGQVQSYTYPTKL